MLFALLALAAAHTPRESPSAEAPRASLVEVRPSTILKALGLAGAIAIAGSGFAPEDNSVSREADDLALEAAEGGVLRGSRLAEITAEIREEADRQDHAVLAGDVLDDAPELVELRYGEAAAQGPRPYMEDRIAVDVSAAPALVAMLDGHGGKATSEFAKAGLLPLVRTAAAQRGTDPQDPKALAAGFRTLDAALEQAGIGYLDGSTATVLAVGPDSVTVAWVGDSQALLLRDGAVAWFSPVHHPEVPGERARVEASPSGSVWRHAQGGPYRVRTSTGSGCGLALTRSLGDHSCRPGGVIAEPDTKTLPRGAQDVWVLASDGVWDVLAPEDVAKLIGDDPDLAAKRIVDAALKAGAWDNCAATVVDLRE